MTAPDAAGSISGSEALFDAARQVFPGGVNSPVRAFGSVGGTPRFIARGIGPHIFDVDGNAYVDYVLSWGAVILGHAPATIVEAVARQAARGTGFGAPTELETHLAHLITGAMPAVEMLRFVSSGTEAVMSAVRLARAVTGRELIVKFDGCYHGHADALLVAAGSGVATLGLPDSPGVSAAAVRTTVSVPYNDLAAVEALFVERGREIAAIVVEPVAGNMGLVPPASGFLDGLRRVASAHGALLIFDEVMTGFRVAAGGAQALYGIWPDLTCLGKVIGGGVPAAAYGGSRDLMQRMAPAGPVYQAGTLSGNPLAMAAGIAALEGMLQPGAYDILTAAASQVSRAIAESARRHGISLRASAVGGMWGFFFAADPVLDFAAAKRADGARFGQFFHECLRRGVYLPPSPFEACFISTAHDHETLLRTTAVFDAAFAAIASTHHSSGIAARPVR